MLAETRSSRDPASRWLQPDEAACRSWHAYRATTVVAMRERHDACRDGRCRTAARTTRRAGQIPWVRGRAVDSRLRGDGGAELRGVRAPDRDHSRTAQQPVQVAVERAAPFQVDEKARPCVVELARLLAAEILDGYRDAIEQRVTVIAYARMAIRPALRRLGGLSQGPLGSRMDDCVQRWVQPLHPLERGLHRLRRIRLAGCKGRRQRRRVLVAAVGGHRAGICRAGSLRG